MTGRHRLFVFSGGICCCLLCCEEHVPSDAPNIARVIPHTKRRCITPACNLILADSPGLGVLYSIETWHGSGIYTFHGGRSIYQFLLEIMASLTTTDRVRAYCLEDHHVISRIRHSARTIPGQNITSDHNSSTFSYKHSFAHDVLCSK